ncbi:MAG: hypothetical protein HY363_06310 [Candidatus Aenigmarchaeota archaeon]|nr:hypothetical protein [Candidatus Aenigmarchaeota archaeon]
MTQIVQSNSPVLAAITDVKRYIEARKQAVINNPALNREEMIKEVKQLYFQQEN